MITFEFIISTTLLILGIVLFIIAERDLRSENAELKVKQNKRIDERIDQLDDKEQL